MRFVIDKYIPFIEGVLEPFGDVIYARPAEITPELVRDADALLVRTRTCVDEKLLGDSRCRFVGTATIGMDHYDTEWCGKAGIKLVNAPGCNAPAVAQYVLSSIGCLWRTPLNHTTIAIVGVGNVGRLVERWCRALGMKIMRVDPPRQAVEGGKDWFTLEDAAKEADIITFHTPLTREGRFATFHLADKLFFETLQRKPLIINAARGPVVDNKAWMDAIDKGQIKGAVIDVWEGEPLVDQELMLKADISTPHIAGYSLDGKIRATQMVLDALSAHFGLPGLKADSRKAVSIPEVVTMETVMASYDPMEDTAMMRNTLNRSMSDDEVKRAFEYLRDSYPLRHECVGSES